MKRAIDLNLLVVLEAIERERSVTRAADALGLSQPAVSHALSRLRHRFEDPLFVRSAAGMTPTPRAQRLLSPIRDSLLGLQSVLDDEPFDPRRTSDTFTIAMNNFAVIVLAPRLVARLAACAPGARVLIRPSGTLDTELLLSRGELDLVVGDAPDLSPNEPGFLMDDHFVAVTARGRRRRKLTTKALAEARYLRISSIRVDDAFVDAALSADGVARDVACEVPYLSAGAVLEQTDMLTIVPAHLAASLRKSHNLAVLELPFRAPKLSIGMKWAKLQDSRPSHRWLRQELKWLAPRISSGFLTTSRARADSSTQSARRPGRALK